MRLIPPLCVKPFVKRRKNDATNAEAILEAASRPTIRFVPIKSAEQQVVGMAFKARDLFVRQKTQAINALRGHFAEHGVVAFAVAIDRYAAGSRHDIGQYPSRSHHRRQPPARSIAGDPY